MVQAPSLKQPTPQPAAAPPAPEAAPAQAPATETVAKPIPAGQEKVVAKDGFAAATPGIVARPPAEPVQTTADLFKDARAVATPQWKLGAAKALTADGTVQTPLSFGEKASLVDFVRGVKIGDANRPNPTQPTAKMSDAEKTAYDALTPENRARYDTLHQEAATNYQVVPIDTQVANPKTSVAALRRMLTSGDLENFFKVEDSLTGPQGDKAKADLHQALYQGALGEKGNREMLGNHTTLSYLAQLSDPNTKLLPGLDRQGLLGSVLHDINHPEDIEQGDGNYNCGGTNVACFLATTSPTEYVRQITGLATDGEVKLNPLFNQIRSMFAGHDVGSSMKFNGQIDPNSGTSLTSQLYGGAFTNSAKQTTIAAPPAAPTDPQDPKTTLADRLKGFFNRNNGINGVQMANELNEIGGGAWDAIFMPSTPRGPKLTTALNQAEARTTAETVLKTASGQSPVFVNMGGHWLEVTRFDPQTGDITYFDPNNHHREKNTSAMATMKADDLFKKVTDFVYQPGTVPDLTVPDSMHDKKNSRNGGGGPSTTGAGSGGGSGGSNG